MKPNTDKKYTGKSFAEIAASINKRLGDRRDPISKQTMALEMENLVMRNEAAKPVKVEAPAKFENGGYPWNPPGGFQNNIPALNETPIVNNLGYPSIPLKTDYSQVNPMGTQNNMQVMERILNGLSPDPVMSPTNAQTMENFINVRSKGINKVDPVGTSLNTPDLQLPTVALKQIPMSSTYGKSPDSGNMLSTGDKIQLGAGAVSGLYNIGRGLFEKAATVEPKYNQSYDRAIQEAKGMRIDPTAAFNRDELATNQVRRQLRDQSQNFNSFAANMQNVQGSQSQRFAEITANTQDRNNMIKQYINQIEVARGEDRRNAQERARLEELQNKSAKQGFVATGISQLGQTFGDIGRGMNESDMKKLMMQLLKYQSRDFQSDEKGEITGKAK